MPTDVERLAVLIEANTKSYERAMVRFQKQTDQATRRAERRFADAGRRLDSTFSDIGRSATRLAGTLGIAFGSAQAIRAIGQASQEYIALRNALKVVGLEGEKLEDIQGRLFAIAQKNGAEIKPLAVLYGRQKQVQTELKASDEELLKFTEGVSLALRVQGSSSEEARGALLQLSQALASGTVRAEEFNSINEGALPILQTVARGLQEAGGSVGKLKLLVTEGKVSSEAFFRAFLVGSGQLQEQSDKMQGTVGQATNRMSNAFVLFIGKLDETISASDNAATNINKVASAIEKLPGVIEAAKDGLDSLNSELKKFGNAGVWKNVNEFLDKYSTYQAYDPVTRQMVTRQLYMTSAQKQAQFTENSGLKVGPGGRIAEGAASSAGQFVAEASGTVSLKDFPVGGKGTKGKKGGTVGVDSFERAIAAAEKRISLLDAETSALGLNAAARERAKIKAELETAAKNANTATGMKSTEVTAAQRIKIDEAANAMALAKTRNEELTQSLQAQQDVLQLAGDSTIDVIKSLSGTAEDRARALTNIVDTLIDALLKASLMGEGPLAGILGTKSATGGVGGLFGALLGGLSGGGASPLNLGNPGGTGGRFGGLRAAGGPVMAGKAYVVGEKRPELFVPSASGRIMPQLPGGGVNLKVNIVNNAGADVAVGPPQRDANGGLSLQVLIDKAVARANTTPGSDANRSLRKGFGLQPTLTRF